MYRIRKIEIEGFGGYKHLALDFEKPVNIFVGRNDAGKTTLANAVRWAVTGRAVTKTRKSQDALINDNAKRARVRLAMGEAVEIERTRSARTESLRFVQDGAPTPGTMREVQAAIYRYFGAETEAAQEAFRLGLRPEAWFERADRHELLQQLLPDEASKEAIAQALVDRGVASGEAAQWAGVAKERGFEEARSLAVEERRRAKRDREAALALKAEVPPRTFVAGQERYDLEALPLEELKEHLVELEHEKDKALRELGAFEALLQAPDERAAIEAEIKDLWDKFHSLNLEQTEETRADVKRRMDNLKRELAKKEEEISDVKLTLPALPEAANVVDACPLLGQPCPVDPATQRRRLQEAKKRRQQAERGLGKLVSEAKGLKTTIEQLNERHEELSRQMLSGVRIEQEINRQKERLAKLPSKRPNDQDVEKARAAVESLTVRINRGRELIAKVVEYRAALESNEKAEAAAAEAGNRIDQLDRVARAFDAAELPAQLSQPGLEALIEGARAGAEAFAVAFSLDDDYLPLIQGKPHYLQSKSGQFRGAVILADAIAAVTKVPWLLLDDCEKLDGENRASLVSLVAGGRYAWVGIFAAQATEEVPAGSDDPEIDVWYLDGAGRCERQLAA